MWTLPESVAIDGDVSGETVSASTVEMLAKRTDIVLSTTRTPKEDWAGARSKLASVPAWTNWVNWRKSTVDDWIRIARDRADLIGGYMHDYNDPTTGIPLAWTTESPEPPDGVTDAEIRFKQAWVFYLRSYNISRTREAARIYALTGDTRYGEWAARQLDFYASNYNLWPLRTENGRARLYRHALDEASGVWDLLDAARLLAGYAGATRAADWNNGLFRPMSENLKTIKSPLNNVGLWQAAGIAGIAMRLRDTSLLDYAINNPIGIRATLAPLMTKDYQLNEGSFTYNNRLVSALNYIIVAAGIEGFSSVVAPERVAMYSLMLSPLDYRFDDGWLPTPGDASPIVAISRDTYFNTYRTIPTWWGVQMANTTQSWEALIDPPPPTPSEPSLPAVTTRNFPGNQMAVLRTGAWQAFVHYGQPKSNHWQEEALNYEIHYGALRISGDPGTVNYDSPFHTNYFRKAPAQNVPLVNGLGQATWGPGTIKSIVPAEARLIVEHPAYRQGVSVIRGFRTTSHGFVERTSFDVVDKTANRLGVAYHSDCSVRPLSGLSRNADAPPVPSNVSTAYWTGAVAYSAQSQWSLELDCKGTKFTYSVTGPTKQTVYIATEPTTPLPATRPVIYYEVTAPTALFEAEIRAH